MSGPLTGVYGTPPLVPGRSEAAQAAKDELSKNLYQQAQPSLLERIVQWLEDRFSDLTQQVAQVVPGGIWGLIVLGLLAVGVVVVVRLKVGGLARSATTSEALFGRTSKTSAQHRAAADRAAAQGAWDEAVLERFRAVVRALEERAIIDERPGRTADEAAADGGRMLPDCSAALRAGARLFDDVAYGSVPALAADDQVLRTLDETVRAARSNAVVA